MDTQCSRNIRKHAGKTFLFFNSRSVQIHFDLRYDCKLEFCGNLLIAEAHQHVCQKSKRGPHDCIIYFLPLVLLKAFQVVDEYLAGTVEVDAGEKDFAR